MARYIGLLLCAVLLLPPAALCSQSSAFASYGTIDPAASEANLVVSRTSPEYTTISLESPNIILEEKVVDFEAYHVFGIPGEPFYFDEGSPAVPQVSRLYRIPDTGGVELAITDVEYEVLDGIHPYPLQKEGSSFAGLVRNERVMHEDAWYPPVVAEISEPGLMRDFRIVTVRLYPVQVNPVTGQARVYRRIDTEIIANDEPGINEQTLNRPPSGSWSTIYRSMIANLDDYALDDATTIPGSYLIIAVDHSVIAPWVDSLYTWKKRKGYHPVVETRTNWTANTLVSFIRNAYTTFDPPLEFVALMGDPQANYFGIPIYSSGWDGRYDHEYALATSGDEYEDIGVGRLCGVNTTEMGLINAKLMAYERNPYMDDTSWFTKSFLYAGVSHDVASNWILMQWADQQFSNLTGVVNNTVANHNGSVNSTLIRQQFNGGIGFFLWRGGWVNEMPTSVASGCNSGFRLPIIMTITCSTGDFDYGVAVSESYLIAGTMANPQGGVAAIGAATAGTHPPENCTVAGGLIYNFANLHTEHLGHCLNAAKAWLGVAFGSGSTPQRHFSSWNNLLGDPALSIWTDVPKVMEVSHPATLDIGESHMAVEVTYEGTGSPVEDARVVLWKGEETYEIRITGEDGKVDIPVTVASSGDMMLTVVKRNHKPYLADIPCAAVELAVDVDDYALDDDNAGGTHGNGNGEMNPGETIDLNVTLTNFGSSMTAENITATISSDNDNVTVLSAGANYPDLEPGHSSAGDVPFKIAVAPTMKENERVTLTINVTASTVTSTGAVELTCRAGDLDYASHNIIGTFEPGSSAELRVTVINNGVLDMDNVNAELVSLSPFVSATDNESFYGDIAVGQQANNNTDLFTVNALSLTFRGHQAPMLLITETSGGYVDTVQFILPVGTAQQSDPTGPDAYGYYAYDNIDVDYDMRPEFNYFPINTIGVDLNLNDSGEKTSINQIWSTVRTLPFPFTFYGESYTNVTICANGWMAFGDQSWYDVFRNYPIPGMQAPDAMIAPYWDDLRTSSTNQGVWDYWDEENHRYIVQWKAGAGSSYNSALDFQVILYDTSEYQTLDGNGIIDIQYQDVVMNVGEDVPGSTVGIQAPGGLVGLGLAFQNQYAHGAATIQDGRAVRFTTNARTLFGTITGTVTDAENSNPLEGAEVTIDGFGYQTITDEEGSYTIEQVLIGAYTLRASNYRYNDATVEEVVVELDSTEIVDFSLTHPELEITVDSIRVTIPEEPPSASFDMINDGNGPFEYEFNISYAGDSSADPWDPIGNVDLTGSSGNSNFQGCEFVGEEWWVTAGGAGSENRIYRFDLAGNESGVFPQPTTSDLGWFDLAFDGDYVYGSEGPELTGIDMSGNVQVTIPVPLNPARAVTYDPATDHFWVGDMVSDLYEIDESGDVVRQIERENLDGILVTGLAWNPTDPEGFKLYILGMDGIGSNLRVLRAHPITKEVQFVVGLAVQDNDLPGGCTITPGWNSTLLVFGGVMSNPSGDRLSIYELAFNTTWIDVTPMASTVQGDETRNVTIEFDDSFLRPFEYRINLTFRSEVLDTTIVIPVALVVNPTSTPETDPEGIVENYALHQNYPNPFNPLTSIRYDLKSAGRTKLSVYNLVGQEVAVLVDAPQQAGVHEVQFNGAGLASGVYFYRLTSGDFVSTRKMVLMK